MCMCACVHVTVYKRACACVHVTVYRRACDCVHVCEAEVQNCMIKIGPRKEHD